MKKMNEKRVIIKNLKSATGHSWFFLLRCKLKSKKLFKKTNWALIKGEESRFAKKLSLSAAIYLELLKKFDDERSFDIIKKILTPIGTNEMSNLISNQKEEDPIEKLLLFFVKIRLQGVGKFVKRKMIRVNDKLVEYEVRDCIFVRFFKVLGLPELAKIFCQIDEIFFPKMFPEFEFSRGDSFENTQAFGKECCNFKFKLKN
jgi:hypothetical protein